jgi:hypothetical protein
MVQLFPHLKKPLLLFFEKKKKRKSVYHLIAIKRRKKHECTQNLKTGIGPIFFEIQEERIFKKHILF